VSRFTGDISSNEGVAEDYPNSPPGRIGDHAPAAMGFGGCRCASLSVAMDGQRESGDVTDPVDARVSFASSHT